VVAVKVEASVSSEELAKQQREKQLMDLEGFCLFFLLLLSLLIFGFSQRS
jgi:hypothetical protein